MTIVTSGLYKLTFEQSMQAVTLFNVYWYINVLGQDDLQEELANAFNGGIIPSLASLQVTGLTYVSIRSENVTGIRADFVRAPSTSGGTLTGEALPSFNAMAFTLNRTTKETRNGSKRYAGAREDDQDAGTWTSTKLGFMDTHALDLAGSILSVGVTFDPVIARLTIVSPPTYQVNDVASVLSKARVSSQVSRKRT